MGFSFSPSASVSSSVFWKSTVVGLEVVLEHEVVVVEHLAQLRGEALARVEVLHADGAARHLVLVGRPDAAPGGADLGLALGALARLVERDVVRQDERAGLRDAQAAARRPRRRPPARAISFTSASGETTTPLPMKHFTLGCRMPEGMRRRMVFLPVDHQRVAGVVPALEAHHGRRRGR